MAQAYQRDTLLSDLDRVVIEMQLHSGPTLRVTRQLTFLPAFYITPAQLTEQDDFHAKNPELVAAWEVSQHRWAVIDVADISYAQIKDNY